MNRTKWTERIFTFDFPEGWMFNVIERLYGTSVLLNQAAQGLSRNTLIYKNGNAWSIQEHIGHLADLEELHAGRIDDFINRKPELRPADMSNKKTNEAHHNERDIHELLNEFSLLRRQFISRLEALDDETQLFQSLHPRLKVMMRPVDMAFFTAEHDNHHLASIRILISQ